MDIDTRSGDQSILDTIQHQLMTATHLLQACRSDDEFAATLYARARHVPELRDSVNTFAQSLTRPYLTPWLALPDVSSTALRRVIGLDATPFACTIDAAGHNIFVGDDRGWISVWNPQNGSQRTQFPAHSEGIQCCVLSTDGRVLVAGSMDATLTVWDAHSHSLLQTLSWHTESVRSCAVSANGTLITSVSDDGYWALWRIGEPEPVATRRFDTQLRSCGIDQTGLLFAAAGLRGEITIWNNEGFERTLQGHTKTVKRCVFSLDGKYVVSTSWDYNIIIWDWKSGNIVEKLIGHTGWVNGCALNTTGQFIISASSDRTVRAWEVPRKVNNPPITSTEERRSVTSYVLAEHTEAVYDCAVSADGLIVSAGADLTLRIWDLAAVRKQTSVNITAWRYTACAVSQDGRIAVTAQRDGTVVVWDAQTGEMQQQIRTTHKQIMDIALSADSSFVVIASDDRTLSRWNVRNGKRKHEMRGHHAWVNSCIITRNSQLVISTSSDKSVCVWNAQNGQLIQTFSNAGLGLYGCALSLDEQSIFVPDGATKAIMRCTFSTGQTTQLTNAQARRVHLSYAGIDNACMLVISMDKQLTIWNVDTAQVLWQFETQHDTVEGCVLHADQRTLASVGDDGTIAIWDVQTGKLLTSLRVDGPLSDCAWYLNSDRLVVTGDRGVYWLELVRK